MFFWEYIFHQISRILYIFLSRIHIIYFYSNCDFRTRERKRPTDREKERVCVRLRVFEKIWTLARD